MRMKIWGGSGKRAVNKKKAASSSMDNTAVVMSAQNINDFEELLSWSNEQMLEEAVGSEWSTARSYAQKRKGLKFLML